MNITEDSMGLEALLANAEKQNEKKKDIVEKGMTCSMEEGCLTCGS